MKIQMTLTVDHAEALAVIDALRTVEKFRAAGLAGDDERQTEEFGDDEMPPRDHIGFS